MNKAKMFSLLFLLFGVALAGLSQQEGWAASGPAKPTCAACHGDFKSVLSGNHPPVAGKEIAACLACHKPVDPEKAAPNPFSARIHRPHVSAKAKVDCLICHTWTPGKSFSLAGQKGSWGSLSKEGMALLKKTADSWSDSPYMDALHARKNVTCAGCHAKRLPIKDESVENDRCLSCHDSYEKLAEKTASSEFPMRNPHRSHLVALDCTKCHLGHQESKSYCLQCHPTFSQKIPGGAAGTSGGAK
jgi:hypothetical protein